MTDKEFVETLRRYWSFDDRQQHNHTWHSREDFITDILPGMLQEIKRAVRKEIIDTGTPCGVCGCLVYDLPTRRS